MKLGLEVDNKDFTNALEKALGSYLETKAGKQALNSMIDNRIDKVLTERNLIQLAQQRLSRVITIEGLKEGLKGYTIDQYKAKLDLMIKQVTKANRDFIKKEVKSLIKIG